MWSAEIRLAGDGQDWLVETSERLWFVIWVRKRMVTSIRAEAVETELHGQRRDFLEATRLVTGMMEEEEGGGKDDAQISGLRRWMVASFAERERP